MANTGEIRMIHHDSCVMPLNVYIVYLHIYIYIYTIPEITIPVSPYLFGLVETTNVCRGRDSSLEGGNLGTTTGKSAVTAYIRLMSINFYKSCI